MKIVTLGDDPITLNAVCLSLRKMAHEVQTADDEEEFVEYLKGGYAQAGIIVMARLDDAREYLDLVRDECKDPVSVIVSDGFSLKEMIELFDAGADDVVNMHMIDYDVLCARLQRAVSRGNGFSSSVVECGRMGFDLAAKKLYVDDQHLHLSPNESSVLEALVLKKNRPIRNGDLLDWLYAGRDEPDPNILKVIVRSIRRKIMALGVNPRHIETVHGVGYALVDEPVAVPQQPPAMIRLLSFLQDNPGSTRKSVCESLKIAPTDFGSLSVYLREKGYVTCKVVVSRGKIGYWSITDEGLAYLKEKETA